MKCIFLSRSKLISLLFAFFGFVDVYGQNIVNNDFVTFYGAESSTVFGCPYFTGANLPNWFPTGGTPHWMYPGIVQVWATDQLRIRSDFGVGHSGESFAGNYHFIPGVTYTIRVGISKFLPDVTMYCGDGHTSELDIRAADGLVEAAGVGCGTSLQDPIPNEIIGIFTSVYPVSNYVYEVTFTPTVERHQLWIFPNTTCNEGSVTVDIDYVNISSCVNGSIDYKFSYEIAGGGNTQIAHIKAGSETPTGIVTVNPDKTTTFVGAEINLVPNLFSKPNQRAYFLAIPGYCIDEGKPIVITEGEVPCQEIDPHGDICAGTTITLTNGTLGGYWLSDNPSVATIDFYTGAVTGHAPGVANITYVYGTCVKYTTVTVKPISQCKKPGYGPNDPFATVNLEVYPNPVKDQINITYPCTSAGQLQITIKDVSGRTRYAESATCDQGGNVQYTVDASNLEAGMYFIELTLNDQHVVKKIVKL